jgi:membrane-bound acyltransferase YfiQ involved in biofilm formation
MNSKSSNGILSRLRRVSNFLGHIATTYLGILLTIGFLVPWILGAIKIHNYEQITSFIEVFVLVSATLSLLSFTYIMALTDMKEKVKKSIIKSGELFFMSTVQFIVGLFLLFLMEYLTHSFLNISNVQLGFSLANLSSLIIFIIQIFILLELIFAVSKFFQGVMGIYVSFRAKHLKESVFYLLSWRNNND